jgi:hypothetical protein
MLEHFQMKLIRHVSPLFPLDLNPKRVFIVIGHENILPKAALGHAEGMFPGGTRLPECQALYLGAMTPGAIRKTQQRK